jgi:uncharacterized repeat protein (TIGR01451 family)
MLLRKRRRPCGVGTTYQMRTRLLRQSWRMGCCAGLWCAFASAVAAQVADAGARGDIEVTTIVEKIVETQPGGGRPDLVPLDVENTGDEVVCTVAFENKSSRSVDNVRITNPIPPRMRYLENSAFGPGADVLYSVDGGRTYGKPSELVVATEDGISHVASASDYTHIRWLLKAPLEAGAKGFARFRAVLR